MAGIQVAKTSDICIILLTEDRLKSSRDYSVCSGAELLQGEWAKQNMIDRQIAALRNSRAFKRGKKWLMLLQRHTAPAGWALQSSSEELWADKHECQSCCPWKATGHRNAERKYETFAQHGERLYQIEPAAWRASLAEAGMHGFLACGSRHLELSLLWNAS